jgi:hypothetical protein
MSISISSNFTVRSFQWTAWKAALSSKCGVYQHDDDGTLYTIYFYDGPEVNICNIWKGTVPDNIKNTAYTQSQNDTDKADFENNYKSGSNKAIMALTPDGRQRLSSEKTNSSTVTFYSSDWTDKTTWYFTSTIVSNEMLTNSDGYYINYNTAHLNLIDTYLFG